ncbi:MAG: CAP domain-containing protein [Planctomycetota bacterium]
MSVRAFFASLVLALSLSAGEVGLEKIESPAAVRVYALPGGREATERPVARLARVGEYELIVVDVDGDGSFDEAGVDGWCLRGSPFLFPFEDPIVVGGDRIELSTDDGVATFEFAEAPARDTKAMLAGCNRLRMAQGLPPLGLDEPRARGCQNHAAYMDRHGITKTESPAHDEYTDEGAAAAKQALVMRAANPATAAAAIFRSFPNRIWLFHARLDRVGIGVTANHIAFDIAAPLSRSRRPVWPVVLPVPNSTGNPTALYKTRPALFDGAGNGLPITLQFPSAEIRGVTAELRRKSERGKQVGVLVSWPEKPAARAITGNAESICIIPKSALQPGTEYFVKVGYAFRGQAGEKSWTFRTAGAGGGKGKGAKDVVLKKRAALKPFPLKRRPRFFFEPASPAIESPKARRASLGGKTIVFVDLDGNGRFGDLGTDGWMQKGDRFMFPLENPIVIGEQEVEFVVESDHVRFRQQKVPVRRPYRIALTKWNEIRRRNGLPPAIFRLELCKTCEDHARYMDQNGLATLEKPDRPGYTKEGARAGRRGTNIAVADLDVAMVWWEKRFGDRRKVFSPWAAEAGVGRGQGHAVLDPQAKPRRRAWTWPSIVPAPESVDQPVSNAGGNPVIFPDQLRDADEVGRTGYPITLFFQRGQADFDEVEAELREGGAHGRRVEVLIAWPKKPAYKEIPSNYHGILVLPRKRLRKKTRYDVLVKTKRGDKTNEHRWWFRTGRGR